MRSDRVLLLLLLVVGTACEGVLTTSPNTLTDIGTIPGQPAAGPGEPGDEPVEPDEPEVNPFSCASNEAPRTLDARRLSRLEYLNTVRSLFERALGPAETTALLNRVDFETRTPRQSAGGFTTSDDNFTVLHATAFFEIADGLATAVRADPTYGRFVRAFVGFAPGSCTLGTSLETLSDACEDALVRNLLTRAWGRPPEMTAVNANDEFRAMRRELDLAATSRDGIEALVFRTLLSPELHFHLELDLGPPVGDVAPLTSSALARRLAYTLTQRPPDEALLTLAATRDLATAEGLETALGLLRGQLRQGVGQFSSEWLHLDALPAFTEFTHPKSQRIRQGLTTVGPELNRAMRDEVVELMQWVTESDGTLRDALTTDISFARQADLMRIYGQTAPAPASVTRENAVRFPAGQRSGLITRAALLSSGTHSEHPIMRGVHLRNWLLCMPTPQPGELPPNSLTPPEPNATQTTRQRYHEKTSRTACQGCHAMINPVGFALSRYNALGAFQPNEPVYDQAWQYVGELPTDSRVDLSPVLGREVSVDGALELSEVVASTSALKACLSRTYSSWLHGERDLPTSTSSCELHAAWQSLDQGQPLRDFFLSAVRAPAFRHRTLRRAP